MSDAVERFKKNQALSKSAKPWKAKDVSTSIKPDDMSADAVLSSARLHMDEDFDAESLDADALLAEIHGHLDAEKIDALLDSCQRECLQAVVRPLGLGRLLFEDMLGGNVATIHNVRDKEYQEEEKTAWAKSGEKMIFESRPIYDYDEYHDGNKKFDKFKEEKHTDHEDRDHSISCSEIHKDPALYLAEKNGPDLANRSSNLRYLDSLDNRDKRTESIEDYKKRLPELEEKRKGNLLLLEEKEKTGTINKKEINSLERLRNHTPLSKDTIIALIKEDEEARKKYNNEINKYYYSKKFIGKLSSSIIEEGKKMGLQQAIGLLMEEFIRASLAEVRDAWKNGFKGTVDDDFLDALKTRLMRVATRVQSKWKDAAYAFRDGFISGLLSNMVTVLINMFATTVVRVVRLLREGVMSLYRAMKTLAFPEEGTSLAEAADAALKIFAAGLATAGGIVFEEVIEKALMSYLPFLGDVGQYVYLIMVGLATGLTSASIVYLLDRLDVFGVQAAARHEQVMERLTDAIKISHERALEAATIFDGPVLHHLT